MNFSPPPSCRHSGRATPSLHDDTTTAKPGNRQTLHLSDADSCSDKPGHRWELR